MQVIQTLAIMFSFVIILGAALFGEWLYTKYKENEPSVRASVIRTQTTLRPVLRKWYFEIYSRSLALQIWARSKRQ